MVRQDHRLHTGTMNAAVGNTKGARHMSSDVTGILEMLAGAVGLLTLMLGVLTLVLDHRRRRRQATLEAYLQAGEYRRKLADATAKGVEHSDGASLSIEESYEPSTEHSSRRDDLKQFLNFWEHLAVGVRVGVFDRKVLKKISGRHVSKLYERYGAYIYFARKAAGYPEYYRTLEELAESFGASVPEHEIELFWRRKEAETAASTE
jgi:hypothetical protein